MTKEDLRLMFNVCMSFDCDDTRCMRCQFWDKKKYRCQIDELKTKIRKEWESKK